LILAVLAVLTWRQAALYRDAISLFRHVVRLTPNSSSAHVNLGTALLEQNRLSEALACCMTALRINPQDPESENALAMVLARMGRSDEALTHFKRALQINPSAPAPKTTSALP